MSGTTALALAFVITLGIGLAWLVSQLDRKG